jgi:hypothetical protein
MKEDRFLKMSRLLQEIQLESFIPYYSKWKHNNAITKNIMK